MSEMERIDRSGGEGVLEAFECALLKRGSSPRLVFPDEEVEWSNDMREIQDEFVVKVHESQERVNAFN